MTKQQENAERIMIICAHPDDEIIGCGGTIAKYTQEGKKVFTVILSYGEGSHPWLKENKIRNLRINESSHAGKIVGTSETSFIGVTDGMFRDDILKNPAVVDRVKEHILRINPDKIFTHSYDDVLFYDHKMTYNTVIRAAKRANYQGEIYSFNIWNPINVRKRNLPKLTVDITNTFSRKVKALNCFKSQKMALYQLTPVIYIRAIFHGIEKGFKFAEIFYKVK